MVRAILVLSLAFGPLTGMAQTTSLPIDDLKKDTTETPAPTQPVEQKKDVEKIEVTGSYIKRIDTEGASPVTTITRKDMEKSGYATVADVLQNQSFNAFGSQKSATNSGAPAGNQEIDLRGLGSSNTLVLLNGQRLPTDAVTGAVDISLIPMAAVERIEILADGASALYGSDALGGVVNIITRKDFSGTEASISQSTPAQPGGRKRDISLTNGFNARKVNMVNVVQYSDQSAVYSRDRSWSNKGVSDIGNIPSYAGNDGNMRPSPSCPASQIKHTAQGDVCTFKYSDYQNDIPDSQSVSLLSETNYEVNSKVKMNLRFGGTDRSTHSVLAPAPGNLEVPASVAATIDHGHPLPGTDGTQPLDFQYRSIVLGNRENVSKTLAYNALVGGQVQLPKDWTLDTSVSTNNVKTTNKGINGYALSAAVQDAIAAGRCNPFDPTQPCNLDGARYQPLETMTSTISSVDVKASGEATQGWAGPIGVAIGGNVAYASYRDDFDSASVNGDVLGGAGSSGGGGRSTRAAFSEVDIPLVKDSPGVKSLELQIAARYDHYSDFGDTANPRAALLWKVNKDLLFRGSAGTGFKAPLMQDLYAAQSDGFQSFFDHKSCDAERAAGGATPDCKVAQHEVKSSGNTGLKAEKSVSYSVGSVYEPTKEFNVSTDLFMIRNKNVVGIDYEDLTTAESKGVNPADYGVIVHRDNTAGHFGHINFVDAPMQNLSQQELTGIDLASAYKWHFGRHGFKLATEHSQMFWYKEEGFPGAGFRNKLGEHGRPSWRNVSSLTYNPGERHDLSLVALTTASQEKTDPTQGRLRQYTQYDVLYAYNWRKVGILSAGVRNVLGTTPPLDDSDPTGMLNAQVYDAIGQQYFTGYKTTF